MTTYTTIEKFVVSRINTFIFKEMYNFIQQGLIILIKIDTKDNVAKDCSFKLSILQKSTTFFKKGFLNTKLAY